LECAELAFATRGKAEAHALKLCQTWIDEQSGDIVPIEPAVLAPQKHLPNVID